MAGALKRQARRGAEAKERHFRAPAELIDAGHTVTGLARSEESAARLRELGAATHTGSLDDLDSLRSGAESAEAWISLCRLASARDRALISAPFTDTSPGAADLRSWISARTEPIQIIVDVVRAGPAWDGFIARERQWFFRKDQGPLWDLGVYGATVLISLFGFPERIGASATRRKLRLQVRERGAVRVVAAEVREYEAELEWAAATGVLRTAFDPAPRDVRNVTARSGRSAVSVSTWDYSVPSRDETGRVAYPDAPQRDGRKFVHGLRQAGLLLDRPDLLAVHQRQVAEVLALLSAIEVAAGQREGADQV